MKRKIKLTATALCVTMLSTLTVTPIMAAKDEDYIDAFGRSWKRVEGGTYYAEETADRTFINRISTYPCPSNNGGKHDLQFHKQAPDCEHGDSNYYVCTLCGEREIISDFPALGHKYESRIS